MGCEPEYKPIRETNPYAKASIFSKLTFQYLHPIIGKGFKQPLEKKDIYATLNDHKSLNLFEQFKSRWTNEFYGSELGLLSFILKLHSPLFYLYGALRALIDLIAALYIPYCVGQFILYFESSHPEVTKRNAYGFFIRIVICLLVRQLINTLYSFKTNEIIIKIKAHMTAIIYHKILYISSVCTIRKEAEFLINLLSNEMNCFDLLYEWVDIWKSIVILLTSCIYMYYFIGLGSIVGLIITMLLMPIQCLLQTRLESVTEYLTSAIHIRVKFMAEIISGIETIKINGWEDYFTKIMDYYRSMEISLLCKILRVKSISVLTVIFGSITMLGTILANTYLGHDIIAGEIFPTMIILNYLATHIILRFPHILSNFHELYSYFKNFETCFINMEKSEKNTINDNSERGLIMNVQSDTKNLIISNTTINLSLRNKWFEINNVNIEITPSKPCVIYGPINCGSSTLINAIMSEFEVNQGKIEINGLLSYASDQPWIVNGSIRNNIILYEDFDEERYQKVCQICILDNDFNKLELGENTMINECTDIITEEQKSRISLARCIYKIADIYLFDFILEETDINIGKIIWKECIRFLKNKCVILTTNCDQYLNNVDHIVTMNYGIVTSQGKYDEVCETLKKMTGNEKYKSHRRFLLDGKLEDMRCRTANNENVQKRMHLLSSVNNFFNCITKICNAKFIATTFVICILEKFLIASYNIYIVKYFNNQDLHFRTINISSTSFTSLILPCTLITILVTIFIIIRSSFFETFILKFSEKFNQMQFQNILHSKLSFYESVPPKQILQRYIDDTYTIDRSLPILITDIAIHFMEFMTIIIIISVINYWMSIPTLALFSLMFFASFIISNTMREITQHRINANQIIQNQMIETMQHISSIRLMNAQKIMEDTFQKRVDLYSSVTFIQNSIVTFVEMCMNLATIGFVAILIVSLIFPTQNETPTYKSGSVGLSVTLAIFLLRFLERGIAELTQLHIKMSTIDGFEDYNSVREEFIPVDDLNATDDWPGWGAIEFCNFKVRSFQPKKIVFKNFSLSIKPEEKVRLIDSTGKINSTIIQSIFRLIDFDGTIKVDSMDIKNVNLHTLRRRISYIAQDPFIFSGKIRDNIDPLQEFSDHQIIVALEKTDLKSFVLSLPDKMSFNIIRGSTVLTLKQKFLLSLTRVILMQNRIIIINFPSQLQCTEVEQILETLVYTQFQNSTVIICYHQNSYSQIKFDHTYYMELKAMSECGANRPSSRMYDNEDEDNSIDSVNTTESQMEVSIYSMDESGNSGFGSNISD